jgi:broad specificity phosphatase PhoE
MGYKRSMKITLLFCGLLAVGIATAIFAGPPQAAKSGALSNAVILIIRHAEKPTSGDQLSAAGNARAQAYPNFFKNFTLDGQPLKLDYLFASADSKVSQRARLTIEPTSKMLGLAIDCQFADAKFQELADEIRAKPHGQNILICWHHGEIPQLVRALGADPGRLFPKGKWPDEVFNWVVELRYDSNGHLTKASRGSVQF